MTNTGDGFCLECGDWFHLDDTGGYNPPCNCGTCGGALCRSCCEALKERDRPDDEDQGIEPFSDAEYNGL